jgi:RNase adaptor protein for sRNA GlmZ degradation
MLESNQTSAEWGGIEDAAGLLAVRIAAWHDFGYATPHFRDPHIDPALRYLTAADPAVMVAVIGTPGIPALTRAIAGMARAYLAAPQPGPLTIAVGCVGGRHRSAAVAIEAARLLVLDGVPVTVAHRDLARPVIERQAP